MRPFRGSVRRIRRIWRRTRARLGHWRSLARAFWRMRVRRVAARAARAVFGAKAKAEDVPVAPSGRASLDARGFSPTFDPAAHPRLEDIRRHAVFAVFARLGLRWVPPEYFSILGSEAAEPTAALRLFLIAFDLDVEGVRRGDARALADLRQVVGILVQIGEFSSAFRAAILDALRRGDIHAAERLVRIGEGIHHILRARERRPEAIPFAAWRTFVERVAAYAETPTSLTVEDADEALEVHIAFGDLAKRFHRTIGAVDPVIARLLHDWPATAWGEETVGLRDDLIVRKERVEEALRNSPDWSVERIDEALGILETLSGALADLDAEAGGERAAGRDRDTGRTPSSEEPSEWERALSVFGFPPDARPGRDEVRKCYRDLAMRHHPDARPGASEAEARECQARMAEINAARDVLNEWIMRPGYAARGG